MEKKYEILVDYDADKHLTPFETATEKSNLLQVRCPNDKMIFGIETLTPNFLYTCPYCGFRAFVTE